MSLYSFEIIRVLSSSMLEYVALSLGLTKQTKQAAEYEGNLKNS